MILRFIFSNSDVISYGRLASSISLLFILISSAYILILKQTIVDIPVGWLGVITIPFGITKFGDILYSKNQANTKEINK